MAEEQNNITQNYYVELLKSEFEKRRSRNAAYSLRSFARQLGISASVLSKTISGKSCLSIRSASRIIQKLKLSDNEASRFLLSLSMSANEESSQALP